MTKEIKTELIAELTNESLPKTHSMVYADNSIYIIDGKRLLKLKIIPLTIWQRIWQFIRFFHN